MSGRFAVLGKGAREHAIARRLAEDLGAACVIVVPGNDGIPGSTGPVEGPLSTFLHSQGVEVAVIGPEALLAAGLADSLRADGLAVVGPGVVGARLEGSKAFAKEFLLRHGIPTARAVLSRSAAEDAAAAPAFATGGVAKYDGLAEGKGVVVCEDAPALSLALADLRARYGEAAPILIEERLTGPELSVLLVVSDGVAVELPEARDHKRLLEGDQGPNTGGMGALSPALSASDPLREQIRREIVIPTLQGLQTEGIPFRGFLFIGLMLCPEGPRVLEYNTRLGDPETQVILPRLGGDFAGLLRGCAEGRLSAKGMMVRPEAVIGVVLARLGYPSAATTPPPRLPADISVPYVVGNAQRDSLGDLRLPGGRALTLLGAGPTALAARAAVYGALVPLLDAAPEAFCARLDIGRRARLAVFASGTGSNLRALLRACAAGPLRGLAEVALVVSDRPGCGALSIAAEAGIATWAAPRFKGQAAAWESAVGDVVAAADCDLIALAGFMRVLGAAFVHRFAGRIVNIHPADTRLHQGLGGYAWALGREQTTITVHLVDAGLDSGPILAQAEVDLRGASTVEEIQSRGLVVEHQLYAAAIAALLPQIGLPTTAPQEPTPCVELSASSPTSR